MLRPEDCPDIEVLSHFAEARRETVPGLRLEATRAAARRFKSAFQDRGPARSVRTFDLITFPYPTRYALQGAALSPAPYVMMRNRVQLVQVESGGRIVNVLINPSDPERSMAAPFFARQVERFGELIARRVMSTVHGRVEDHLRSVGVSRESIDYITFDHLHVQDLRGMLGTERPEPGNDAPTPALFPNAKLLVQREELDTVAHVHPMQRDWYVDGALTGVDGDRIVVLGGDVQLGQGLALIRTPGHTGGNHTPVLLTDGGVWTISENGVCVDAYAPEASEIAGVRRFARDGDVEVVLNANTRESSLDQYTSMVLEKTVADRCPDRPEFPQHFSSSEMVRSRLAPGLRPTYSHASISHGEVTPERAAASTTDSSAVA
ncbi:MAG: hypothetical protein KJO07_19975 [Deltaproteobacteria bacterium]|nr:hypothetical protein [Deltaproteobacteria bacterium]